MPFGINNKAVSDAIVLGAGLTIGFILVSGGIKLLDKSTGGIIPDQFANALPGSKYASAYQAYGSTLNTLAPGNELGMFDLS